MLKKYLRLWYKLYPFEVFFIFFRPWSIQLNFGNITKNLNPAYFLIGIINALAVLSYFLYFSKNLKKFRLNILVFILLNLANIVGVIFSEYPLLSLLFWGQLNISYLFIFTTPIWLSLIAQKNDIKSIKKLYYILSTVVIYDFILMIAQFIVILKLKNNYLNLPKVLKRILFNGYFIDRLPPQRFDFNSYFIRSTGLLGDTNVNTMLMFVIGLIMAFTLFFLLQRSKNAYNRHISVINLAKITILLSAFSWIFSFSRSALLGGIVVFIVVLIVLLANKILTKRVLAILAIGIGVFFIAAIGIIILWQPAFSYVKDVINIKSDKSFYLHTLYMRQAFNLSRKHKFKPLGLGAFPRLYTKYINPKVKEGMSAHSTYFTVLVEQGILGLLIYSVVFIISWYLFINNLLQISKKKTTKLNIFEIITTAFSAVLPFYTISTIFYYGFWDIGVWFWTAYKICNKK